MQNTPRHSEIQRILNRERLMGFTRAYRLYTIVSRDVYLYVLIVSFTVFLSVFASYSTHTQILYWYITVEWPIFWVFGHCNCYFFLYIFYQFTGICGPFLIFRHNDTEPPSVYVPFPPFRQGLSVCWQHSFRGESLCGCGCLLWLNPPQPCQSYCL